MPTTQQRRPRHRSTTIALPLLIFLLLSTPPISVAAHALHNNNNKLKKLPHTLPRLYIPPPSSSSPVISPGTTLPLTTSQIHHLITVRRLRHDDNIRLFDGYNGEWLGQLQFINDDDDDDTTKRRRRRRSKVPSSLSILCLSQLLPQTTTPQSPPPKGPWLYMSHIKPHRLKFIIEKGTELGVDKFIIMTTVDRCSTSIEMSVEKLQIIAIEAAEQSERLSIPHVIMECDLSLDQLLLEDEMERERRVLICRERMHHTTTNDDDDEEENSRHCQPLLRVLKGFDKDDMSNVSFFVGPEGGWSDAECDLFETRVADYYQKKMTKRMMMMDDDDEEEEIGNGDMASTMTTATTAKNNNKGMVMQVDLGERVLRAESAAMLCVGVWSVCSDGEW